MSFELLPTLTPWLVGFVAVATVGVIATLTTLAALAAPVITRSRRARLGRGESLRRYYGQRLALHH